MDTHESASGSAVALTDLPEFVGPADTAVQGALRAVLCWEPSVVRLREYRPRYSSAFVVGGVLVMDLSDGLVVLLSVGTSGHRLALQEMLPSEFLLRAAYFQTTSLVGLVDILALVEVDIEAKAADLHLTVWAIMDLISKRLCLRLTNLPETFVDTLDVFILGRVRSVSAVVFEVGWDISFFAPFDISTFTF